MNVHPVLFSGPMVRAIVDGHKTQTRRVYRKTERGDPDLPGYQHRSPFGEPGDRLWVREIFFSYGRWETRLSEKKGRDEWRFVDMTQACDRAYQYAADNPGIPVSTSRHGGVTPAWWKRPAIYMPRAASRITLEVTGVRIERLQDISEADAIAEGVSRPRAICDEDPCTHVHAYADLWDSLNAGRGFGWDVNPWVWIVEFRGVT